MGPNEGCHLVCSPLGLGWERREGGGRATNTERTTLQCYCSIREREREGLTPLVLIKRVSSERGMEWAADAARDQRRINNAAILIPKAGQTRQGPNNMLTHPLGSLRSEMYL